MTVKQVFDLSLLSLRDAAKGYLVSCRASNRYAPSTLTTKEFSLGLLAEYAEAQGWPGVAQITASHVEDYLVYLQERPRWFGERDKAKKPPSQAHLETQYRRIKTFFNWLKQRGHVASNPLDLIPHPHVDERVIPTVSQQQMLDLLALVDPALTHTPAARFLATRNRAALFLLGDTPGRRDEIASLVVDAIDLDVGQLLVMGKGRKQRWMPIGDQTTVMLWEYIQARARVVRSNEAALWLDDAGKTMTSSWLYLMLKRLGKRANIPDLHTHRFRHTYAINALRAGMQERLLMVNAGWRRVPDTYFRTLAAEDVKRVHQEISPMDRLSERQPTNRAGSRKAGKAHGKL